MPKRYILQLALRYLRAKQETGFINIIASISIIGVFLGVMVLITVLSIMNGFQTELRSKILDMTPHITVFERDRKLNDWEFVREQVMVHPNVQDAAPSIEKQALLSAGKNVKGALIKGVLPRYEDNVSNVSKHLEQGELSDLQSGQFNIILGTYLADDLGVTVGDKITVVIPQSSSGLVGGLPRLKRFTVQGILNAGMYEYDSGYAYVHLKDAATLYRMGDAVSDLQLKTDDLFGVAGIISTLGNFLELDRYFALSWTQQHANFFQAIQLEKRIMFIVVALIIMVAIFNIVSAMVMMVNEKKRSIAILRTQGMNGRDVLYLFAVQGIILGFLGTILGCLGGYALASNIDVVVPFIENLMGRQFFPADVYYISKVPSELQWADVIEVALFSFILTILATIYPAIRASKVNPAQVLRYE